MDGVSSISVRASLQSLKSLVLFLIVACGRMQRKQALLAEQTQCSCQIVDLRREQKVLMERWRQGMWLFPS